ELFFLAAKIRQPLRYFWHSFKRHHKSLSRKYRGRPAFVQFKCRCGADAAPGWVGRQWSVVWPFPIGAFGWVTYMTAFHGHRQSRALSGQTIRVCFSVEFAGESGCPGSDMKVSPLRTAWFVASVAGLIIQSS